MLAMPGMRAFSLATKRQAGRVSCSEAGVCVGHIPLLECLHDSWAVRPIAELNDELTGCYQLPVLIIVFVRMSRHKRRHSCSCKALWKAHSR